jgi:hypothetical protein
MVRDTFDFHVDAKHFNFMWGGPMYITVSYTAWVDNGKIKITLDNMTAAQDHAVKFFSNTCVSPTTLQALTPFI